MAEVAALGVDVKRPSTRRDGIEFNAIEREAFGHTQAWLDTVPSSRTGRHPMPEATGYAVPVTFPAWVRKQAAERGLVPMGLVPHYRAFILPQLALFHPTKVPQPRQRIRLTEAYWSALLLPYGRSRTKLSTEGHPVFVVEDWKPLRPESVYSDSSIQAKDVRPFYEEHLNVDENVLQDLLLPSTSAAYGTGGGLDVAGRAGSGARRHVKEFYTAMAAALPPEFRRQPVNPKHAEVAYHISGPVKFGFSDLPPPGGPLVESHLFAAAGSLERAMQRSHTGHENSLYATVDISGAGGRSNLRALFEQLTAPHCVLPETVASLVEHDLDLSAFVGNVDVDLWKGHALLREHRPLPGLIDEKVVEARRLVADALNVQLMGLVADDAQRERLVRSLARNAPQNLLETGLGLARLEGRDATGADAMGAYKLFNANLTHLMDHPDVRGFKLDVAAMSLAETEYEIPGFDILENAMDGQGAMTFNTIAESLVPSPGIESTDALLALLEGLESMGWVYQRAKDQRWVWVNV